MRGGRLVARNGASLSLVDSQLKTTLGAPAVQVEGASDLTIARSALRNYSSVLASNTCVSICESLFENIAERGLNLINVGSNSIVARSTIRLVEHEQRGRHQDYPQQRSNRHQLPH